MISHFSSLFLFFIFFSENSCVRELARWFKVTKSLYWRQKTFGLSLPQFIWIVLILCVMEIAGLWLIAKARKVYWLLNGTKELRKICFHIVFILVLFSHLLVNFGIRIYFRNRSVINLSTICTVKSQRSRHNKYNQNRHHCFPE